MNYSNKEIKLYSDLLSFTSSTEELSEFNKQNKALGRILETYHIEVTILAAIKSLQDIDPSYILIRDEILDQINSTSDSDRIEIEKRLDVYLSDLMDKNLIDSQTLTLTDLGEQVLTSKIVSFYQADQISTELN